MGAGDGVDDGQAKSVSAGMADSLGAELLERLEKAADLVGRDHCSGVADRDGRPSGGRCRRNLGPASGHVVAQGVVHQAGHQAFGQALVTRRRSRSERCVLPYILAVVAPVLPAGPADWVLRVTPAAAFAVQQSAPQYAQVSSAYTPFNGYYPLAPWAGFAVLCGYAALALALAIFLLRQRDA